MFRVILNGTAERTQIGQLKGTLSEATGRSVRILQEDNTVRIEVLNDELSGEGLSDLLKQLPLQGRHGRCHFIISGTNIESSLMESLRDEETVRIVFRQAPPGRQDSPASMPGAEALSGEGDFLFCNGKRTKRIQGPMVTPEECRKIADYLRTHN